MGLFFTPKWAFSRDIAALKEADSLFAMAQYTEALSLYKKNFTNSEKNNQPMVLKLAFLSERTGNYSDVLFYLSQLALVNPSRTLFEKMDKMASEHNLKGYDFNDYSYFIIFYRRYGAYLPLLLLVFGAYIIYIMYWKTKRRQGILIVHKLSILTYLLVVGVIINLPSLYRSAVITNPKTFLRENPTAASSVVDRVGKGHRVTILGSVDHWYRIIWNNSIVYIRHSDVRNI